jgi:hypothetical protein
VPTTVFTHHALTIFTDLESPQRNPNPSIASYHSGTSQNDMELQSDSDNDSLCNDDAQLTEDDLAFGTDASLTSYTNIGEDGFDVVTGLPALDTIQEDFDAEVHAAGAL